jgi:4-hydroxybenzoyl-CoA thioesterase
MAFLSKHRVRFADIDRAGIVYFPRFFDFFHRALEDFFDEDVRLPYHQLIDVRRVGLPVVHIESDFKIPLQHGDVVTIELCAAKLGTKSVGIRYRAFRPGAAQTEPAAISTITHACIDMETFRAIPLPDDVRAAFARHPA